MNRDRISALDRSVLWSPQPGPQLDAFLSPADQLLYGGAAGGGKSDLLIGLALTLHRNSLLLRREGTQLHPIVERTAAIVGSRDGLNATTGVWRLPGGRTLRLGGCPNVGDEMRFQGMARDGLFLDEAANFTEGQFRYLAGWVRSTVKGQRCRIVLASNPLEVPKGNGFVVSGHRGSTRASRTLHALVSFAGSRCSTGRRSGWTAPSPSTTRERSSAR